MTQTRDMIEIDEELCDGCGLCVPSCHEGAIQIINGKARLVSDSLCDGLGACLGHCPQGALKVTHREAAPFVAPVPAAASTPMPAHTPAPSPVPAPVPVAHHHEGGCPGSRMRILKPLAASVAGPALGGMPSGRVPGAPVASEAPGTPGTPARPAAESSAGQETSQLSHWPVQIRLVAPTAPFLDDARLVVAADCVPVALPGFHRDFVAGNAVMIGCPKFDDLEAYTQRFTELFSTARVRSVTVVVMEVPCCRSLPTAVKRGIEAAGADVPLEVVVVGVDGEIRQRMVVPVTVAPGR